MAHRLHPHTINYFTLTSVCVCGDLSPTPQICAEVRIWRGHSFWATYPETSANIDLQGPFNNYWSSDHREFTVLSQLSQTSPCISDREGQAIFIGKHSGSLELRSSAYTIVRAFSTAHSRQLIIFAWAEALRSSLHQPEGLLEESPH